MKIDNEKTKTIVMRRR